MSYKSGYQGGPYYELLSTQGKDSMNNWKVSNSGIKKIFDKEVKGYILTLEGASATTKVQSPKDQKQSLTLIQRYIVLQIYLLKGADFSMEFGITDLGNNKRRILLSTSQKEIQVTPLHAKVPLTIVHRAIWLNLALDMVSLVGDMWTGQTFRSVDQIAISANCKLKRVFTMKSQPPDTTEDEELELLPSVNTGEMDHIPKQCQLSADVEHLTQVLTLSKIKSAERVRSGKGLGDQFRPGSLLDLDLNSSGRKIQTSDGKIAFGSKAPRAPETGRKTSRQGSVTSRSSKSQTSKNDSDATNGQEELDQVDYLKQQHPGSAGSVSYSQQAADSDAATNAELIACEAFSILAIFPAAAVLLMCLTHLVKHDADNRTKRVQIFACLLLSLLSGLCVIVCIFVWRFGFIKTDQFAGYSFYLSIVGGSVLILSSGFFP